LITTFLSNSSFAADLSPTQYLLKGEAASYSGFLVEQDRLQMCVVAVQDANYYRDLSKLQEKYYTEKLVSDAKIAELQLELKTKEAAAVEKGLKKELAKKSVWYKNPFFVAGTTALVFILTGSLIP